MCVRDIPEDAGRRSSVEDVTVTKQRWKVREEAYIFIKETSNSINYEDHPFFCLFKYGSRRHI